MKKICLLALLLSAGLSSSAQNLFPATGSAGIGTTTPAASSLLDMTSTTKGVLFPRMTQTQRNAIVSPATGLVIFQTNNNQGLYYYNGTTWIAVTQAKANQSLNNLTSTAINAPLIPGTTSSMDLGSTSYFWQRAYVNYLGLGTPADYSYSMLTAQDVKVNSILIGRGSGGIASNTIIGKDVFANNSTGASNTVVGSNAFYFNTTGNGNTALGFQSLWANTTGQWNTCVGYGAGNRSKAGNENTYIGYSSGYYDSTGVYNTALGSSSMTNATGMYNTALGVQALRYTQGNFNIGIGYKALYNPNLTSYNIAIGDSALLSSGIAGTLVSNGSSNIAIGSKCMKSNTVGNYNVAIGHYALSTNDSGYANVALGDNALVLNKSGFGNTGLGYVAYLYGPALSNTTAIGYGSGFGSASNRIEIGNTSVSYIGGQVNFAAYSDARIKEQVQENVPGLTFINKLRPVTYHFNVKKENDLVYKGKKEIGEWDSKYDIEKIQFTGFLAQEVEKAAKDLNYEFSGVVKPSGKDDLYALRYAEFVVPIVKAVQELSSQNTELKNQNDQLKEQNADLQKQIDEIRHALNLPASGRTGSVQQMKVELSPNPTRGMVELHVSGIGQTQLKLTLADMSGRVVLNQTAAEGASVVDCSGLQNGTYLMRLLSGDQVVHTEQLVVSK